VRVALSDEESQLLQGIVHEYLELLDAEREPGDPVMTRLFPSASIDDPFLEADFRQLADDDLHEHKLLTARRVLEYLDAGDRRPLTEEEQEAWLVLLTDVRLAMGVRLGVTEETFESFPNPNDPAQWPLAVLHYLGSLQESLVAALDA
jgi:Domain of unknown function (DUF2017)